MRIEKLRMESLKHAIKRTANVFNYIDWPNRMQKRIEFLATILNDASTGPGDRIYEYAHAEYLILLQVKSAHDLSKLPA